jgi:hypothetical protein
MPGGRGLLRTSPLSWNATDDQGKSRREGVDEDRQ